MPREQVEVFRSARIWDQRECLDVARSDCAGVTAIECRGLRGRI